MKKILGILFQIQSMVKLQSRGVPCAQMDNFYINVLIIV